jgi:hypothetical protein
MATAIIVLLLVAALVALSIVRPAGPYFANTPQGDHERERQLAELRALAGYRGDVRLPKPHSWKATSRSASSASSCAAAAGSEWNGSHRTSPST